MAMKKFNGFAIKALKKPVRIVVYECEYCHSIREDYVPVTIVDLKSKHQHIKIKSCALCES